VAAENTLFFTVEPCRRSLLKGSAMGQGSHELCRSVAQRATDASSPFAR
jgi:hypothetical protein